MDDDRSMDLTFMNSRNQSKTSELAFKTKTWRDFSISSIEIDPVKSVMMNS